MNEEKITQETTTPPVEEQLITQEQALMEIKNGEVKAEKLLKDEDKLHKLLLDAEKVLKSFPERVANGIKVLKLKRIPTAEELGDIFSKFATFIDLIRSYVKGEYKEVPVGTIISIISVIIYVVSPIDLIPDITPIVGLLDDIIIIGALLTCGGINYDLEKYIAWRNAKEAITE